MIPTVSAVGTIDNNSSICLSIGAWSLVPVMFAPGSSALATSPASIGSVTAVNRTAFSFSAFAIACEAGVDIDKIRSLLPAKRSAILCRLAWSPWAFW